MNGWPDLSSVEKLFGLIGYPLSHSFSKKYFNEKFEKGAIKDHYYELFPLDTIELFPRLIDQYPNLVGLNVTLPYKQLVIQFLDELDEGAALAGAVNTIKILPNGLKGYNTDVLGFEQSLLNFFEKNDTEINGFSALILGTGGAAKAVEYVMKKQHIPFQYVSRFSKEGCITYEQVDEAIVNQYQLIINTTPLGMSPKVNTAPHIPYDKLDAKHFLFDLVYNPEKTLFLKNGENRGAKICNGLEMLVLQAEFAWEIWTQG